MKPLSRTAVITACCLSPLLVHAQSSVTLYGLIDESIRFTTNQSGTAGASNRLQLTDGAIQGSRWGLKGSEDLGGGTQAIFNLESGYSLATGAMGQGGLLFGRQAWVGLTNPTWGRLRAGRLYGAAFGTFGDFDILGIGNYNENAMLPSILGCRFNNMTEYTISRGPLSLQLQYAFGGQAGEMAAGSTAAADIVYSQTGLEVAGVAQESKDENGHRAVVVGAGANYTVGPVTLYALYVNSTRGAGFSVSTTSGAPLYGTSLLGNANTVSGSNTQTAMRRDNYASFAARYMLSPAFFLSASLAIDNVTGVNGSQSGKIRQGYLMADYFLSKRTDVYAELDRNVLGGASVTDPNSPVSTFADRSGRTGAAIGLRTRF
ncbi:porin [Caballeronia sp. LjRoot34]|uniref:porin n=1 Tax=Caballeronia sp. LjRoot34 TaxID=3342325 RepID=UPI003ECFA8DC